MSENQVLMDFNGAEHDRQLVGNAGAGQGAVGPGSFQRHGVEELGGGDDSVDRFGRQTATR